MMKHDRVAIVTLIDELGPPSEVRRDQHENVDWIKWKGFSLIDDSDFSMKIGVPNRAVTIIVTDKKGQTDTFLFVVDDFMTALPIYLYFRLKPAEFAWQCGFVLYHDEEAGEWTASGPDGTVLFREIDAWEVKSAIFETVTGLTVGVQ